MPIKIGKDYLNYVYFITKIIYIYIFDVKIEFTKIAEQSCEKI